MRRESQLVASGFGWWRVQGGKAGVQQECAMLSYLYLSAQHSRSTHGRLGVTTCLFLLAEGRGALESAEMEE